MFSDYIVYVDESGDHSLQLVNPVNPVFVLAFCIFEKLNYVNSVVPFIQTIKFDFWGHDSVVFHSHEIRKSHGDFRILLNPSVRASFLDRLNKAMNDIDCTVIAAAIDKRRLIDRYARPGNPYRIALTFCMERLQRWLIERAAAQALTHIVLERRGRNEDTQLETEFHRIRGGDNHVGRMPNLDLRFMDKKHNSTGLQIADLVAHPIGRHVVDPAQHNRAYEIVGSKLRRGPTGVLLGYGLKVFP